MLYLILKEDDYDRLSLVDKVDFTELSTSSIIDEFIFVNYTGTDYNKCLDLMIENKIRGRMVEPFISRKSFDIIYDGIELKENTYIEYRNYSFFEDLIANYARLFPQFNTEYILLPTLSTVNKNDFLKIIYNFNHKLYQEKLLLTEENVRPSLTAIYLNSFDRVIEEEVDSEFILTEDIRYINSIHSELILSEFLIQASKHYTTEQIKRFINNKIYS